MSAGALDPAVDIAAETPRRRTLVQSLGAGWDLLENPVLGKEFRSRMRGSRAYVIQGVFTLVVMAAVLITYYLLLTQTSVATGTAVTLNQRAATVGRAIWSWGCMIEAMLLPLIVPAFTCGAITLEREREMLELLLLTRQSAFQICMGKLASGVGLGLILVISSVPALSLSFVLGGVSPGEVVACVSVILASVVAAGSLGLSASTILPRTVASTAVAYLVVGLGLVGMPILMGMLNQANQLSAAGGEGGILLMLVALMLIAFPPGIGIGVLAIKLRESRGQTRATRAEWMMTCGLAWCALLGMLYIPGASQILLQGGALVILHPVVAIIGVMQPTWLPLNSFMASLWWIATVVYLGVAVWLFYIATLRVRRMRAH